MLSHFKIVKAEVLYITVVELAECDEVNVTYCLSLLAMKIATNCPVKTFQLVLLFAEHITMDV